VKELDGLRLNALCRVDEHHRAVRGDERAVGILGEVLVARRIQNIDVEAVVIELHDRRRDGNAALLFDLHPVGGCVLFGLARLDRTGLMDRAAVEQELLGQRRFTRVGVRDDGEGSPALHFLLGDGNLLHRNPLLK